MYRRIRDCSRFALGRSAQPTFNSNDTPWMNLFLGYRILDKSHRSPLPQPLPKP
jgi:hypothetical protein